jgi:hypothetical protein
MRPSNLDIKFSKHENDTNKYEDIKNKENIFMVEQKIIEAFYLMWNFFPEPIMPVEKNRTILAVNRAAEKDGRRLGIKCSSMPPLERHSGCKANAVLSTKEYQYAKWKGSFGDVITYRPPIDGYPDYFIHFSVGRKLNYTY